MSGLEFDLSVQPGKNRPFAPSLDRIDSTLGYAPHNVRLVCGITNTAMSDWGVAPLMAMAHALVSNQRTV